MTKRDLIDAVKEGANIEIHEATPILQEGDAIADSITIFWYVGKHTGEYPVTRYFVGRRKLLDKCEWCGNYLHQIVAEGEKNRTGLDGKMYSVLKREIVKNKSICPKCGDVQ